MNDLLDRPPYGPREDGLLLERLNELVRFHKKGSPEYARIVGDLPEAGRLEDLPFLHVGLFKHLSFRTTGEGIRHGRTLLSSSTSGAHSMIALDDKSSALQEASSRKILADFIGEDRRPLLVVDSAASLAGRGRISARIAAAMGLKPFSTDIYFLLKDADDPGSMKWDTLSEVLERHGSVLVYGFSWILWQAWGGQPHPQRVQRALRGKQVTFVHSGGWKKLEDVQVDAGSFNARLLEGLDPASKVVDFYGLVEQVGVVYPLCGAGYRHPPVWAEVIVRDSLSLEPLEGRAGQLQLIHPFAWGAPYHSVYTEDLALVEPGPCPCGRSGKRFKLLGRVPQAEPRGCSNV